MTAKTISTIYLMLKADYEAKYDRYLKSLDVNTDKEEKDRIGEELDDAVSVLDDFNNNWNGGGKNGKW